MMERLLNLKFDLEHNKIISDSPDSLQKLATNKIALCLWHGEKICIYNDETTILKKIASLKLYEAIEDKIGIMATLIANQLQLLKRSITDNLFEKIFCSGNCFQAQNKIYWTSQCTIDKKRTIEALADCIDINVETRFELATNFYLEKQINFLSVQLPRDYLFIRSDKTITDMECVSTAREHFGISQTTPLDYKSSFRQALCGFGNEISCLYYWHYHTEVEKAEIFTSRCYNRIDCPNMALFLFTEASRRQKLELLEDQYFSSKLFNDLLNLQGLFIFNTCIDEIFSELYMGTRMGILSVCTDKIYKSFAIFANKKMFAQIIVKIFNSLHKMNSIFDDQFWSYISDCITNVAIGCFDEEEIKLSKMILESIEDKVLRKWFLDLSLEDLTSLLSDNCLEQEISHFVLSFAFSSVEERETLFTKINPKIVEIIVNLIFKHCFNAINVFLNLFSAFKDIQSFKAKFDEGKCFQLCHTLFESYGHDKYVNEFLQWRFSSEDEIMSFCKEFLQSKDFKDLFSCKNWDLANYALAAFVKTNNLGKYFSDELYLELCFRVLSKGSECWYPLVFESLDLFLLACCQDDEKKRKDLKKRLFTDKRKKFYIIWPLKLLYIDLQYNRFCIASFDFLWPTAVAGFFKWICSSDEVEIEKINEEFWNSEKVNNTTQKLRHNFEELWFVDNSLKCQCNRYFDDNDCESFERIHYYDAMPESDQNHEDSRDIYYCKDFD